MTTKSPHRGAGSERLAKRIARAGLASRRDAETMIEAGRVTVNGKPAGVATNVSPEDRVVVDGKALPAREPARLWLYHKPSGLVTTERDEKGRDTVFDAVREELGRVLSVGRLDLTSEGLLLLTNDGDLKRRLELPETGWLRRYRVRVNGHPDEAALERLREGLNLEGEKFAPMQVALDRTQGANAWLTMGLREGRNREIRRAMEAVGVMVTRLIRVSYGPFQLGKLAPGEIEELRPKVLRDQLGSLFDGEMAEARRDRPARKAEQAETRSGRGSGQKHAEDGKPRRSGPRGTSGEGKAKTFGRRIDGEARTGKSGSKGKPFKSRSDDASSPRPDRRANPSASFRNGPRGGAKRGGTGKKGPKR